MIPAVLSHAFMTGHLGESNSGPSPRIWRKFIASSPSVDGDKRLVLAGDDFLTFGPGEAVASNVGQYVSGGNVYKTWEDTGASVTQQLDEKGGVIALITAGTDNHEVWIQPSYSSGVLGAVSDTAADAHLTAFECRLKVSSITDTEIGWFIGLGEEGLAAQNTLVDGGTLADADFLGFQFLETDGDAINFVYKKNGQTQQTAVSGLAVPVANTYIKLGWVFNPNAPTAERITAYVDNVASGTFITGTNIANAAFPDGEEMSFLAGLKNATGSAMNMHIDYWLWGQMIT